MSGKLFGVGAGVFIIVFLWTAAVIICILIFRTQGKLTFPGIVALSSAATLSGILLGMPRGSTESIIRAKDEIIDSFFIWRIVLVLFLAISLIASMIFLLISHWMEPIHAYKLGPGQKTFLVR